MVKTFSILGLGLSLCMAAMPALAADPLPALGADAEGTSVSGLSSGAFMAGQYQVAFSASIKGSGIVAGGPYYCAAEGGLSFTSVCMGQVPFMPPNASLLYKAAQDFAKAGKIDALDNLKHARIYVFSGTKDSVVKPQAVNATVDFFKLAQVPATALKYENAVPAGHALITMKEGNPCEANASPYISHCTVGGRGYDQAGKILAHIYGKLASAATTLSAQVQPFNQREFAASSTAMADTAYVYIPKACQAGQKEGGHCRVHVAFHGCKQSAATVGDQFYTETGYNRWADTNHLIVLYPQVDASTIPFNPSGCWDWFGYTGLDYATKSGAQMVAVQKMIERLQAMP